MFKYFGFGLFVQSEVEFPELLVTDFEIADVTIKRGSVPLELTGPSYLMRFSSVVSKCEYLLNIKHISKYYAGYGNEIIFEPVEGADEKSVRLFILGSVMAAIIYQRGWIPLHASAVIDKGELVVFAGNSGAGKSTLAATLVEMGFDLFTDDVCVFRDKQPTNGAITGFASYPMMKLWDDTIKGLNNSQFNRKSKVRPSLPKYSQFFYDEFHECPLPVKKIFILTASLSVDDLNIEKLEPLDAFKDLEKMAYRRYLISVSELKVSYFTLISNICALVPVYKIKRPHGGPAYGELANRLIQYF